MDMARTPWPAKGKLLLELVRELALVKREDIVYLQRTVANKYFFVIMAAYLLLFRRKMIFDFDDPVYVHTFFKTKFLTKLADVVIVCTHGQAEWAKRYNANVHIFHIALDFSAYQKFTKNYEPPQSPLVIGWIGTGPEHIENLKIFAKVLRKLVAATHIPFTFTLIGSLKNKRVYDLFTTIPDLHVTFIDTLNWTDQTSVPQEIQKFDIGVLPHQHEGAWVESKTSFKNLEYMACGVATVVSRFGEMPHVISDGVNGYIAATEEEWVEKLGKLLADVELRAKLGKAGQEHVREHYSFDAIIPRLIRLINSLAESTIS